MLPFPHFSILIHSNNVILILTLTHPTEHVAPGDVPHHRDPAMDVARRPRLPQREGQERAAAVLPPRDGGRRRDVRRLL